MHCECYPIPVTVATITVRLDSGEMLDVVGYRAEPGIRKTRNGESFGKYAQTVLTNDVNYRGPSAKAK
jgi:hypothetical protein